MLRKTKLTSVAPPVQTVLWLCVLTRAGLPPALYKIWLVSAVLWAALQQSNCSDDMPDMLLNRGYDAQTEGLVVWVQGLVSAMLWQALQLLDQPRAPLHASHAE